MFYSNMNGCYCGQDEMGYTKADRKALLEEKKAILEAKLATIKHWIEAIDQEEDEADKK